MPLTIAFDVYGTLIDTQGVVAVLEKFIGDKAAAFSQTWREKQLEYSFRKGLMEKYEDFGVCTSQALNYTCQFYQYFFTDAQKKELLDHYQTLPAFADVENGLLPLKQAGHRLFAFSNGNGKAVNDLLKNANILNYFDGVVSCHDVATFKPSPTVYEYFLTQTQSSAKDTWLISSNSFDVLGALAAGFRAAWVQRNKAAIFDPWGIEPTATINNLDQLKQTLAIQSLA